MGCVAIDVAGGAVVQQPVEQVHGEYGGGKSRATAHNLNSAPKCHVVAIVTAMVTIAAN